MSEPSDSGNGTFVWYDLKTREFEPCWRFYSELFRWSRNETDRPAGHYSMIRNLDRNLGGIIPLDPDEPSRPHWTGYVGVADIESCVDAVLTEGGSVALPPTLIPEIGIFAIVSDPFGATLSAFQWTVRSAAPLPVGEGAFCWSELLTPDPYRVEAFYRAAFGWRLERGRPGAYGAYWLFRNATRAVAGMVQRPSAIEYPPHWLHYVRVTRLDGRLAQAATLGGGVLLPPTEIPDEGRFAILRDPGAAIIGLYEAAGQS